VAVGFDWFLLCSVMCKRMHSKIKTLLGIAQSECIRPKELVKSKSRK
jgi:hypothetical protein